MPVSIHRSESNIIYKTYSWRKTPLILPFYNVGFIKLFSEVILHIPKLGQEKKINILGTTFPHLQTAGWLQICPFVTSQWVAVVVSMKYHNLGRFSLTYSMKVCCNLHFRKSFISFTYLVYLHVCFIYIFLFQITILIVLHIAGFKVILLHDTRYCFLDKQRDIQLDKVGLVSFEGTYPAFP